jgi:SpoIID/LytB domain protein
VAGSIAGSEVQLCLPGVAPRTYRGDLVAEPDAQTENVLPLEDYVDGVVPAESPPSWMGTGGEAALQALAVAARSVAVALVSTEGSICDTTQCQVYEGVPDKYGMAADGAVSSTAGQVLYCDASSTCGPTGSIAVAEYSSSTGGYTAGGAFPAVPDLGDSIAANPVHAWTVGVTVSQVDAAFPSIGDVEHVTVTKRNGLGQIGGRVEELEVVGNQGSVILTGNQFAADFDLYSDWFAVRAAAPVTVPTSQTGVTTSTTPKPSTDSSSSSRSGTSTTPGRATGTTAGPRSRPPVGARGSGVSNGYWVVNSEGDVLAYGAVPYFGTAAGTSLQGIVTAMAATPNGKGYWLAGRNGGVLAFGNANWYGSASKLHLAKHVIGITPAPGGKGYWLVASDGGIFAYGDAHFYGSVSKYHLKQPIVAIAATPSGHGYWLVSRDGGIFAFGNAGFYGSAGDLKLNRPIVGIIASPDGRGYSLVAKDGGVFAFGDARFQGSLPGDHIAANVVGVSPAYRGRGYYVLTARGKIYTFGNGGPSRDPALLGYSVPGAAVAIVGNGAAP